MMNALTMQHYECYANIQMNVSAIVNVTTTQRCRCYAGIAMDVFVIVNVATMQLRRCYAGIAMDVFVIVNVATMQLRRCYADIPMDVSAIVNVMITQRCKRCTYDSPGLTSESEVNPGSFAVSGNNAVGVVPFIYWYFIEAFHAENVQHLWR